MSHSLTPLCQRRENPPAFVGGLEIETAPAMDTKKGRGIEPALFLSLSREAESLALGMDDWGLTFADRNLAFTGAAGDAKGKDC